MGLFNKIKKSIELKQNIPNLKSIEKTEKKILNLKKQSELNPTDSKILIELYACYVEISDLEKKIECLKKLSNLSPNDSYPLQQLADIYAVELKDMEKSQFYQTQVNKIRKFF